SGLDECTLVFDSGHRARVACKGRPIYSAEVSALEEVSGANAFRLVLAGPAVEWVTDRPRPPRSPQAWPPSVEDPTVPLIARDERVDDVFMMLVPVRWGSRRYLVRLEQLGE